MCIFMCVEGFNFVGGVSRVNGGVAGAVRIGGILIIWEDDVEVEVIATE